LLTYLVLVLQCNGGNMSYDYEPNYWVILKLEPETEKEPIYKILGGWSGGYLDGDSWRMNSGITKCHYDEPWWYFDGHSGSVYRVHINAYGLRGMCTGIYNQLKDKHGDKVTLMPDGTNWNDIEW